MSKGYWVHGFCEHRGIYYTFSGAGQEITLFCRQGVDYAATYRVFGAQSSSYGATGESSASALRELISEFKTRGRLRANWFASLSLDAWFEREELLGDGFDFRDAPIDPVLTPLQRFRLGID